MSKRLTAFFACALWAGSAAFGQTMVESAVSAAGGSVAGVAGKKVSEGIDAIFSKVSPILKKAGETGDTRQPLRRAAPIPALPSVSTLGAARSAVAVAAAPARRQAVFTKPTIANVDPVLNPAPVVEVTSGPEPSPILAAVFSPEPPPLPARDLSAMSIGASRQDVLAAMGKHHGSVSVSSDEGFVETYRYPEGTVRLVNGKVAAVRPRVQ